MKVKHVEYAPYQRILLVSMLLMCWAGSVFASTIGTEQAMFKRLLQETYQQIESVQVAEDKQLSVEILTSTCESGVAGLSNGEILREKSRQEVRVSGLELRGAYSTGDLSDTDEGEDSFEQGRANLELSWELLKHGLLHQSRKADALELEAQKAEIVHELDALTDEYLCRRYQIKKNFFERLIQLLNIKINFMTPVHEVERRAYFKRWSFLDDYMVSQEDLVLARHELNSLLVDPYFDASPQYGEFPPIIDVHLAGLLSSIRADDSFAKLFEAEKGWLEARERAVVHDSLRVYLRQEFDVDRGGESEDDFIAGLRFRVPLHFRDSDVLDLQLRQVEQRKRNLFNDRINQTRLRYTELQEQLRRTMRQYYRHARAMERADRTLRMVNSGEDELITAAITRMRTAIEAQLEFVRALEELYRRVNEMFLAARVPFRPDLIRRVSLVPEQNRARYGNRALYVWSHDFNTLDNKVLSALFHAKSISTVILSAGKKTNMDKLETFLTEMQGAGIDVGLMIGDNSWIFPEKFSRVSERSIFAAEQTGHLHYDIEPQAMPEYTARREEYIGLYTTLITKVKERLFDRKLSISIPFHWPEKTYRELGGVADALYVMAYGTSEPEVLLRRLQPIISGVSPDKIVISLRTSDFKDEWAMEKMIERIVDETALMRFCIHDLGSYIQQFGDQDEFEN